MFSLVVGGNYIGGVLIAPATSAEFIFAGTGSSRELRLVDFGSAITSRFAVTSGGLGNFLGQTLHTTARTGLIASTFYGSVLSDMVTAALAPGQSGSVTGYLHTGAEFDDRIELLGTSAGSQTYLIGAGSAGAGFSVFSVGPGNAPTEIAAVGDTVASYSDGISAIGSISVAGHTFILTGSATEGGVSSYEISAGGQIQHLDSIGVKESLPLEGVTVIRTVSTAGEDYVVVGTTTNSGLTVLTVAADGGLAAADHVVDDLTTRYSGVTALGSLTVNGRSFVVAGGADGGITLFTLLPGGQLVHLQTLADSLTTSLAAPSAIGMTLVGNEIQVFVSSGTEIGVTMIRIDVATLGQTLTGTGFLAGGMGNDLLVLTGQDGSLSGGGGADILRDGAGTDTLSGGAGNDIFVLTADGKADTILDFEVGKDRIDLTLLPYLRNLQQLTFTPIAGGVVIRYGIEIVTVMSADGSSLTGADFPAQSLLPLTRFPIVDGATGEMPDPSDLPLPTQTPLQGTDLDDTLTGTPGDDFISGLAGNDVLIASVGTDHFDGGAGADTVSYALLGAAGIDLSDPTRNWGSASGHSFAAVENFIGSIFGDDFRLDDGDNILSGGSGDDTLFGGGGDDTFNGDEGNDHLYGQAGNDWIDAGPGNDSVNAGDGDDFIDLSDGDDVASGAAGNDSLIGGAGNDIISGSDGDDELDGGSGNDLVAGGAGADRLAGGAGHDTLNGGAGDDQLDGGSGDDTVIGLSGDDLLVGGDGNDTLSGGAGDDSLTGGLGADVFVFDRFRPGEIDIVTDYEDGADRLWLGHVAGQDDAARFSALSITDTHAGAEIAYGGQVIILAGVAAGAIDIGDILFV